MPQYKFTDGVEILTKDIPALNISMILKSDMFNGKNESFYIDPKNSEWLKEIFLGIIQRPDIQSLSIIVDNHIDFMFDNIAFGDSLKTIEMDGRRTELLVLADGEFIIFRVFLSED